MHCLMEIALIGRRVKNIKNVATQDFREMEIQLRIKRQWN